MIGPLVLASLLSSCAPRVAPETMQAIVMVESGANPLAIGDNTTRRSYSVQTYEDAVTAASALVAQGHSVDLGIAQVNSTHLARLVTIADLFDPCRNLEIASGILTDDYLSARRVFAEPQRALRAAIGAYNSGSIYGGAPYIARVEAAAGVPAIAPVRNQLQIPVAIEQRSLPLARKNETLKASAAVAHGSWGHP